jgi:cytochrome c-type biogenesis protein CcmH/NrfG
VLGRLQLPLARILIETQQWERARAVLESSRDGLRTLLEADPRRLDLRGPLAEAYASLADVYRQLGDADQAEQALRHAEQYRPPMGPMGPMGLMGPGRMAPCGPMRAFGAGPE